MKITRAPQNRKYIEDPRAWAYSFGTDYIFRGANNTALITSGTAGQVLSEYGWVTTALSYANATGADFLATGDRGSPHIQFTTSGDLISSPSVFGAHDHGLAAAQILGYFPSQMFCRVYANFSVNSADEPTAGFGFIEAGGVVTDEANHLAIISSDGTNFQLAANGGAGALTDVGAAVDATWHYWDIVMTLGGSTEWFIDGTSQGSVALTADVFPTYFVTHVVTNDILLGWVHIGYR